MRDQSEDPPGNEGPMRRRARAVPAPAPALALVLSLVAALGALHLPSSFSGDAALYQAGALALDGGLTLYRDFWDLKAPGIYAVHWLAGTLFGFGPEGLHLLELLLLLVLCVMQVRLLRSALEPSWPALLAPVAGVGTYYVVASEWHLTQPAVLLNLPLFALLALLAQAEPSRGRWAVAGIAAACAVVLKPYALPIVVGLVGTAALLAYRVERVPVHSIMRRGVAPFAITFGLVLLAVLAGLAVHGGLTDFAWTHGEWRELAASVRGEFPWGRSVASAKWFVLAFAPWLLLVPAAALGWRGLAAERVFVLSAVWLAVGGPATALEPFAGWEFDFLALLAPTALLAARGLHGLVGLIAPGRSSHATVLRRRLSGRAATLMLALLPAVMLLLLVRAPLLRRAVAVASALPFTPARAHAHRLAHDRRYGRAWATTGFLREADAREGAIYVFGDPLLPLLADRPAASAIHGFAWELQPPGMWERLAADLETRRPEYVFVAESYLPLIGERGTGVAALLERAYRPHSVAGAGRWYERREPASVP